MPLSLGQFAEIVIVVAILSVFAYWGANLYLKARVSQQLLEEDMAYKNVSEDQSVSLLVLGDSTAVGIGANTPEETVPGRFAAYIGATYVENHAVVGAAAADIAPQLAQAALKEYSYVLVMVGGNDILSWHDPKEAAGELEKVLKQLKAAKGVYVMAAGNVGGATIFPHPVRPFHTRLNLRVHEEFTKVAAATGATYINMYQKPSEDPFFQDPERYLSGDGLHPSSDGYQLWFEKLKEAVEKAR